MHAAWGFLGWRQNGETAECDDNVIDGGGEREEGGMGHTSSERCDSRDRIFLSMIHPPQPQERRWVCRPETGETSSRSPVSLDLSVMLLGV